MLNLRSLLLLALCAAGCSRPSDDVGEYIAARTAHRRAFDSLWSVNSDSAIKVNNALVRENAPRLRRIVGSLEMPGLVPDSVKMNIGSMSAIYEAVALADGFVYLTTDSVRVFVTDTAIFRSGDQAAALRDASAYNSMFDLGAAAYRCAVLPDVRGAAAAIAIEYSQDQDSECSPDYVAVSVVIGRRLLAAQKEIPAAVRGDSRGITGLAQALTDRLLSTRQ